MLRVNVPVRVATSAVVGVSLVLATSVAAWLAASAVVGASETDRDPANARTTDSAV